LKYKYFREEEQYYYYGRVLATAKLLRDENPMKKDQASPDVLPPEEKTYIIWVDFYELTSKILNKGDSISIEAQVQNTYLRPGCDAKFSKARKRFRWKKGRCEQGEASLLISTNEIPDIFIRIFNKTFFGEDECIGYARFKAEHIIGRRGKVVLRWEKIRMVKTDIVEDSEKNYLGSLLCSMNVFTKDKNFKRPIYVESKNMKKYKLVSLIYMANDLPPMNSKGKADPKVEVSFNGKSKCSSVVKDNLNPVFGEALFISTVMSDNLELSDNIKLNVFDQSNLIGSCDIPIVDVKKYNHQDYVENEIYKDSKWFYLYNGTKRLNAEILVRFFIVRLIRQGKEKPRK